MAAAVLPVASESIRKYFTKHSVQDKLPPQTVDAERGLKMQYADVFKLGVLCRSARLL